jgi:general nucleoside transport system ATP-binding protein
VTGGVGPAFEPPIIELREITKRFPGVLANDRISLNVRAGEIHALVGENGAGKTTLVSILYGLYPPDAGQVLWRGRPVVIRNPRTALQLGIGMVHQHFMLIPPFTVLENIILGAEPVRAGVIARAEARARVAQLVRQHGFDLDLEARVETLSVGEQQRVEILKVLYRGAQLLILDEPTAVLVPQEVRELFRNLRRLREEGRTLIFISHKLDEVLEIADRITVLRRGGVIETVEAATASPPMLAEMMVGRPVLLKAPRSPAQPGAPRLEVQELSVEGERGRLRIRDVTFNVRAGEVYAVAGVQGNGQAELVEAIVGLRPAAAGRILIDGRDVTSLSVAGRRAAGLAHIPEDRQRRGLVLAMSARENLILGHHRRKAFSGCLLLDEPAVDRFALQCCGDYDVRIPGPGTPALALSGGNQQRLVIAREFAFAPALLIAAQPTRGLDVGATEFVYRRLVQIKEQGLAVLLVSVDLDEVLALADRIAVLYNGRIAGEFRREDADAATLGLYMTGSQPRTGPAVP